MVFVLTLIFGLFLITECSNDEGRYLVYPPGLGNKVQFIVGIGVPVSNLPTIQSVTWGYVIKTNYVLPTNITEYGNVRSIRKRSTGISRWDFYQSIADVLNRSGLPGEQCIQRSICETARIKFARNDIIGEFLHILLLPSSTGDTETMYYDAEIAGLDRRNDCSRLFSSCSLNLIDLFSIVRETSLLKDSIFPM
ncbi:uncharacterized protein LOC135839448 [Planococcus citri]|uniref:uncharacterized protein LOC135839448 n=1 Tax=Planococcus citri TaxID=170843 RepID=UPI0031F88103